jgi:pimeloyl-ACP methyl ester carboxylesterase
VLVGQIPDGAELEADIVCHSRGGLVARVLAEKQSEIALGSRRVKVRKVAFVGTPNAGTILADADHFGELVDTYTNLLNFFPDTGVVEVLQTVIAVVKQLAVGAVHGLAGLDSMVPGGEFLCQLNREARTTAEYFALASDFEPESPGFRQWATDCLVDSLFARAENDLVVPTLGVYDANGSPLFPIPRCEVLRDTSGVGHSRYFSSDIAQRALRAWLEA